MNITSAKYFPDVDDGIANIEAVIDGVTMTVPVDPDNRHYAAILEWVAEGNTIEEAD